MVKVDAMDVSEERVDVQGGECEFSEGGEAGKSDLTLVSGGVKQR
jgi:hypothetical protein